MRALFGCLAVLLGAVSIALAARYGYKGADTVVDGLISAVVFGAIALCAFIFDAAAVRLWFMPHRFGAVVIGSISAAALVVTFTNSLGAIAGRADTTQAERARAKDEIATDHAELGRIVQERTALGQFTPATDETVTTARAAVTAAEQARVAECEKRGPRCREREKEEEGRRDSLAAVLTNKELTVRAAELDADAKAIRARIAKAQADTRTLGSAVSMFTAHMGALPAALTDLTSPAVNGLNQSAGPFMASVPAPPPGGTPAWGAYGYASSTSGTFSVTATGDGTTITVP